MSRSYKGVHIKKHDVYTVEDLKALYSVSANTVSNWVREGFLPSDRNRPYLFQGAAVIQFHRGRQDRQRKNLRPGEFKCTGCKAAVFPEVKTIQEHSPSRGAAMYFALCPDCGVQVYKIRSEADRDIVEDCRNPNTSREHLHEENDRSPGGIGISGEMDSPKLHFVNDRIIHAWQEYAGRYDEKTVASHLAAIRYCEKLVGGKCFSQFGKEDANAVREGLKRRSGPGSEAPLSASSIRHKASHLKQFFEWLVKQEGHRRMPRDLPDYFELPKAFFASSLPKKTKEYPGLSEAEGMLKAMPDHNLSDQRARAIFALAFLSGQRADALISLRIEHVDLVDRRIRQDARVVRSKNGKSQTIFWFPIPDLFEATVQGWVSKVKELGCSEADALFPTLDWLKNPSRLRLPNRQPVPVMSTPHAVTEAFAIACRETGAHYTPHSARHTLAAERDMRPLTQLERKAWSENLGHETEQITETHYGKLTEPQRVEVLEGIGDSAFLVAENLSQEEKAALVDGILQMIRRSRPA